MRIGSFNLPFDKEGILNGISGSKRNLDIFFAVGVLCIVGVLIFPIPPMVVDFLLSISITLSVLILMTSLFIDRPLDFSSFPTVLLVVTMLRLSLSIATTRLILSKGHTGTSAAGHVVEAFGYFVMQGSVIIGVIVFAILTIINFIVITKGSGRIAEVAARFSLDAMPGKQMAIDADLSAGLISEEIARSRRKHLEDENTFFGAMDGANKFVRGDAIAALLIIFINFVAGIIIGTVQMDMSFEKALTTYTILTIGDGLVTQIPALIVSTGAGLLVTKSGSTGSAEKAIFEQLGSYPKALGVSSGLIAFMAMMPGIPAIPFLFVAGITSGLAYYLNKAKAKVKEDEEKADGIAQGDESVEGAAPEDALSDTLQIDTIKLELGYELLSLINYQKGHKLTDQIKALRKQIARDMGFIIPSIRIQDNLELDPTTYCIKIKDIECGRSNVRPEMLLVMEPKGKAIELPGEVTTEPAFGLAAKWILEDQREEALFREYTVVDPPTVIITHLTEIIKENITELLTYSQTQKLIDGLSPEHKKLASEIIPSQISTTILQRILQQLLAEGVSIRDLSTILEAVSEISVNTNNASKIAEHVRTRLSKQICHTNTNERGYIPIVILSPQWEQAFSDAITGENDEKQLIMAPSKLQEFVASINKVLERHALEGEFPVILTSSNLRPFIRAIVERLRANIVVLSQSEIHPKAKIKTIGQI
ncbi:Flagellar biosynthesis protein FlhA [Candidatus Jidaibacter acanthamoeba]|uniref:Flagellar biosynthesis protein FlhA n=1 Tax=Candidatus Jidaibacter acanthamoebae TaxID=86105 RepID=A0A0C1QJW2_9RICK|nr:flagellar biosynthesis protein FlhA [Candidatus Jidaibacter acanthamoeba]KIE04443.1 Flagellar biosynthesis protein FlhA [Candidatus Jidaibacter acanthamoeba]